jgi:hypothetical protein
MDTFSRTQPLHNIGAWHINVDTSGFWRTRAHSSDPTSDLHVCPSWFNWDTKEEWHPVYSLSGEDTKTTSLCGTVSARLSSPYDESMLSAGTDVPSSINTELVPPTVALLDGSSEISPSTSEVSHSISPANTCLCYTYNHYWSTGICYTLKREADHSPPFRGQECAMHSVTPLHLHGMIIKHRGKLTLDFTITPWPIPSSLYQIHYPLIILPFNTIWCC